MDYATSATSQTSGIAQLMATELVSKQWGPDGYTRWLRGKLAYHTTLLYSTIKRLAGISAQYTARRDFMLDCLFESPLVGLVQKKDLSTSEVPVYYAYAKSPGFLNGYDNNFLPSDEPLFSFSSPNSGVSLWVKLHLKHHRDWVPNPALGSTLEHRLWTGKRVASTNRASVTNRYLVLAERGVVVSPGYMFSSHRSNAATPEVANADTQAECGHMRLAFSAVEVCSAYKYFVQRLTRVPLVPERTHEESYEHIC